MKFLPLNGEWELIERPLSDGPEAAEDVLTASTAASGCRPAAGLTARVPGDVNDSLVRAGCLPEPLTALNYEKFAWIKERSWWFRK